MATDTGIDPRYAPQFQRGFDPARHVAEPLPERRGPLRIENGPPPVVQRVPAPPPVAERAREELDIVPAPAEPPSALLDDEPVSRPRAEWVLLGVGVGFLVVAAVLFQGAVDQSNLYMGAGPGLGDQLYGMAITMLPGPFLVAGTVAICVWIALRAIRSAGVRR